MTVEFHYEAELEYSESIRFYFEADPGLAQSFQDEIEATIAVIATDPLRFRVARNGIRRCLAHKFPFGVLFAIESEIIMVYAVMHLSREPEYWTDRLK